MSSAHICSSETPQLEWRCRSELKLLWLTYLLHGLVVTAWIGALINHAKTEKTTRPANKEHDPAMPMLLSHHQWLLRTAIGAAFLTMVSMGTLYSGMGYAVAIGTVLWWVYRMGRGILALMKQEPLPTLSN